MFIRFKFSEDQKIREVIVRKDSIQGVSLHCDKKDEETEKYSVYIMIGDLESIAVTTTSLTEVSKFLEDVYYLLKKDPTVSSDDYQVPLGMFVGEN